MRIGSKTQLCDLNYLELSFLICQTVTIETLLSASQDCGTNKGNTIPFTCFSAANRCSM